MTAPHLLCTHRKPYQFPTLANLQMHLPSPLCRPLSRLSRSRAPQTCVSTHPFPTIFLRWASRLRRSSLMATPKSAPEPSNLKSAAKSFSSPSTTHFASWLFTSKNKLGLPFLEEIRKCQFRWVGYCRGLFLLLWIHREIQWSPGLNTASVSVRFRVRLIGSVGNCEGGGVVNLFVPNGYYTRLVKTSHCHLLCSVVIYGAGRLVTHLYAPLVKSCVDAIDKRLVASPC